MAIKETISKKDQEEWLLADYLCKKIIGKASGELDSECHFNLPRDIYFIGNLRPRNDNELSLSQRDLMQKLSPSAFGAEFKITTKMLPVEIKVTLKWDCYYRLFPSYEQQVNWMHRTPEVELADENEEDEDSLEEKIETPPPNGTTSNSSERTRLRPREEVYIRFKKISCIADGSIFIQKTNSEFAIDQTDLNNKIQEELQRVMSLIANDPERMRLKSSRQLFTIPQSAFGSPKDYNAFLSSLQIPINNVWNWEISKQIKQEKDNVIIILFQFVNTSPNNESDKTVEPFLFNPKVSFAFPEGVVLPFDLELAPQGFRYDRKLWGRGFNCGLTAETNKQTYTTENAPMYSQNRYSSRVLPKAGFEELIYDPVKTLDEICTAMEQSLNDWEMQDTIYRISFGEFWEHKYKEQFDDDKDKFKVEIQRFKQGIMLLKENKDISWSFTLMNEVFRRAGYSKDKVAKKDRWRLFQIVFIVSQIPGIAALLDEYKYLEEERKYVDIIYFPTGGGKTEAYLGTLIFHCFFDRLRGKSSGVTSWIRFPLRLLTLQQTQRLADVIGIAELVRSEQQDARLNGISYLKFSIGYYVGSEGTPNEIKRMSNNLPDASWAQATDPKERQNWKRVVTCPYCKTNTVRVDFDEVKVKIIHRCINSTCRFKDGVLPVFVTDNEIYRYLPTVIVGTIDKLASLGHQRKMAMLFGKVDGYCKEHGYYNSKCCEKDCIDVSRLVASIPPGLSGPTLFIQDELHLLREGIGTFDSHYETFAQELVKQYNGDTSLKIIASSATIEKYDRQVEHLYGKKTDLARIFPCSGPTNQLSFYAETKNYPQRIFIGILPHNKTLRRAILELLEYYHRILQDLARLTSDSPNPYRGEFTPGSQEWVELIDLYYSSLSYFSSNKELDSLKTEFETFINHEQFGNEGYLPVNIRQLTGGTSTDEVSKILEEIERPHALKERHDAILGTSMVSHGVDIDRLNCMLFYGIPKQNAEYIQASSRVGRTHVGIVFNCFNPIRERDQSHYSYFVKYHEFLGQLVEPVAINRWSTYGIDKTLPGLFLGVLLQILSNRENGINRNNYYFTSNVSKRFTDRIISKEGIKSILAEAYTAGLPGDIRNDVFNKKIDKMVDIFFDNIMSANNNSNNSFVQDALYPPPLRSLRDIDEQIKIELDSLGVDWTNKK